MDPNILSIIIGIAALIAGIVLGKIIFAKNTQKIVDEVDKLLAIGEELINYGNRNGGDTSHEMVAKFTFWTTRTGELLTKLYPKDNHYHKSINQFRATLKMINLHSGSV
ncbi:MAG: hypothetical protein EOO01_39760, partial [Chitinophagaceae bacterium]